jgi:hypothetical protein
MVRTIPGTTPDRFSIWPRNDREIEKYSAAAPWLARP